MGSIKSYVVEQLKPEQIATMTENAWKAIDSSTGSMGDIVISDELPRRLSKRAVKNPADTEELLQWALKKYAHTNAALQLLGDQKPIERREITLERNWRQDMGNYARVAISIAGEREGKEFLKLVEQGVYESIMWDLKKADVDFRPPAARQGHTR